MKVSIRAMRVNCGMSQSEAAKRIGVKKEMLASWEKGLREPRTSHLISICNVYGCELDDLILPTKLSLT